mmetsp:Transcript_10028/g.35621  ORF Transcript_10028/g.35621 Transcript_10028/m.35621 type:complete len:263 (+) Transcript_10028:547-1335(+)
MRPERINNSTDFRSQVHVRKFLVRDTEVSCYFDIHLWKSSKAQEALKVFPHFGVAEAIVIDDALGLWIVLKQCFNFLDVIQKPFERHVSHWKPQLPSQFVHCPPLAICHLFTIRPQVRIEPHCTIPCLCKLRNGLHSTCTRRRICQEAAYQAAGISLQGMTDVGMIVLVASRLHNQRSLHASCIHLLHQLFHCGSYGRFCAWSSHQLPCVGVLVRHTRWCPHVYVSVQTHGRTRRCNTRLGASCSHPTWQRSQNSIDHVGTC